MADSLNLGRDWDKTFPLSLRWSTARRFSGTASA